MIKKLILIIHLLSVMLLVSSCSNNSEKLVLGTGAMIAPFSYLGGENGDEAVGFDIELAKIIAKELGRELEIKILPFQDLLTAVDNGEVDMAISCIGITDERKAIVDFSDAYFYDTTIALVKKNDIDKFRRVNSPAALGAENKMAVMGNIIQEKYVVEAAGGNNVLITDTFDIAVEALINNEVDAVIMTTLSARNYMKKHDEVMVLRSVEFLRSSCGVVVKKGEKKLLEDVNSIIKKLLNSGEYDKMMQDYVYH